MRMPDETMTTTTPKAGGDWAAFLRAREEDRAGGEARAAAVLALQPDAQAVLGGEMAGRMPAQARTPTLATVQLPSFSAGEAAALPLRLVTALDPAPRTATEWPAAHVLARDVLPSADDLVRLSLLDDEIEDGEGHVAKPAEDVLALRLALQNERLDVEAAGASSRAAWRAAVGDRVALIPPPLARAWLDATTDKAQEGLADFLLLDLVPRSDRVADWTEIAVSAMQRSSLLRLVPQEFASTLTDLRLRERPGGALLERALAKAYHMTRARRGQ